MGIIENSFKRELGKNTGKVVSNLLFGDKHSTPYRRVDSTKAKEVDAKIEKQQKEQLFAIDNAVLKNIDAVAAFRISNKKDELLQQLSELSVQLKANRWHETFNNEEGKIRNKFTDALFEKYKQCVHTLKAIDSEEPQLPYFQNIVKKTYWRKYIRTYPTIIGFVSFFSIIGIIAWIDSLNKSEQQILLISFLTIVAIVCALLIYFKFRKKTISNPKNDKVVITQEENKNETIKNEIQSSIFIDLNENNRIENKLSAIWTRYKNHVNKNVIGRIPIFSADGVTESILFVGINPSYNPNDDNLFIKGENNNSLMYGSLYQLPDAPEYFKNLEVFAHKIGKSYTHINLLYVRENDRELLSQFDSNFIREQLELTYETIIKINPVAIIFFSDYCKELIFGADRWINPNTEIDGSYILNGTKYPVFFSDDITLMEEDEQMSLIQKIKLRIQR